MKRRFLLGAIFLFFLPLSASAQLTWSGGTNGTWNATNLVWNNGTTNVVWVSGASGTFVGAGQPLFQVNITGTQVVSGLTFTGTTNFAAASEYFLSGTGTLQTAAGGLTIYGFGGQINVPIIGTGGLTTLGGSIVQIIGGLPITGYSGVVLEGKNTYSGGTVIQANSVLSVVSGTNAQHFATLGTGGVVNNGTLNYQWLGFSGGGTYTENNVISGTGQVADSGSSNGGVPSTTPATFILNGANTYSGGTTLYGAFSLVEEVVHSSTLSTLNGTVSIISGPYGTGTITMSGYAGGTATMEDNGTAITLANSLNLSGTVIFASVGNGSLTFDGTSLNDPVHGILGAKVQLSGSTTVIVSNTTTIADNISDHTVGSPSMLIKDGLGTLILTGSNTYTAGTRVVNGTLLVANTKGSATGTSFFDLSAPAILAGTGTINSTGNSIAGTVHPGATALSITGSLILTSGGTTTFASTANLAFNLATNGDSTELNLKNSAVRFMSGSQLTLNLNDSSSTDYTSGLQFELIAATGGSNQFSGITVDSNNIISGLTLVLTGTATNGQADSVFYSGSYLVMNNGNIDAVIVQAVPEPQTLELLFAGVALIASRRFFRRRV